MSNLKPTYNALNIHMSGLPRKEQCQWERAIRERDGYYVDKFDNVVYGIYRHRAYTWWDKIKGIWRKLIR